MRPKISGSVAATVALVGLLVGVVALLVAVRSTSRDAALIPVPTTSSSGTASAPGTGRARPSRGPSPSGPAGATSTQCVQPVDRQRLSVVTFNIHSARDHDGGVHLDQIADALAAFHADVYLLQEVDRYRLWSGRLDMPSLLADHLGMAWTFGANVARGGLNTYGTAILSRFPITSSENVPLPAPPGTQQRGLLHAVLDVDGVEMSVYDTHLENTSSTARLSQIQAIVPILKADRRPKVFGGDLNSGPSSGVVLTARSAVSDTWATLTTGGGFTHPAASPSMRIDYLFHAGGDGTEVTPVRAQVLPAAVSDHRPFEATYLLSTGTGQVCVPLVPEQSQP